AAPCLLGGSAPHRGVWVLKKRTLSPPCTSWVSENAPPPATTGDRGGKSPPLHWVTHKSKLDCTVQWLFNRELVAAIMEGIRIVAVHVEKIHDRKDRRRENILAFADQQRSKSDIYIPLSFYGSKMDPVFRRDRLIDHPPVKPVDRDDENRILHRNSRSILQAHNQCVARGEDRPGLLCSAEQLDPCELNFSRAVTVFDNESAPPMFYFVCSRCTRIGRGWLERGSSIILPRVAHCFSYGLALLKNPHWGGKAKGLPALRPSGAQLAYRHIRLTIV